ncbi:hypothetical protein [Haloarchaeobius amylolyticus]|uniref:hypothetical protein n=1 Tax=Haloarchaeobius amylolyticus TaxID=1198296 RepID=UPI00226FCCDD|nr:hypothetical protein [Haloarchaeobius amylolyticus]
MSALFAGGWRPFVRDLLLIFAVLVLVSVTFAGYNTLTYVAVLAARVTRDMFLTGLGDGIEMYLLVGGFLFVEALIAATGLALVKRRLRRLFRSPPSSAG